jgi:hypothetical protein
MTNKLPNPGAVAICKLSGSNLVQNLEHTRSLTHSPTQFVQTSNATYFAVLSFLSRLYWRDSAGINLSDSYFSRKHSLLLVAILARGIRASCTLWLLAAAAAL